MRCGVFILFREYFILLFKSLMLMSIWAASQHTVPLLCPTHAAARVVVGVSVSVSDLFIYIFLAYIQSTHIYEIIRTISYIE